MEAQTRLSRHNKFISADNIIVILFVSSDDSLHVFLLSQSSECLIYIYIYIYIYILISCVFCLLCFKRNVF